jgi:hypothetical protein
MLTDWFEESGKGGVIDENDLRVHQLHSGIRANEEARSEERCR